MKRIIGLTLFLILGVILSACSEKEGELPKVDIQEVFEEEGEVTRVDVQKVNEKGDYEDVVTITDPEKLNLVKKSLVNVKWNPNVEAEMARKEDVFITLFHSYDKNMPERLYEYRIWFEENETATIISNKETEGFGELDRENTQNLKNALAN
ncbi:hypothetical protein M3193_03590 [Sporosarcina luteola]|uniref:hypothetical protein n=1 Tax=Sporosarcina luteola TaxID=582850 RepID=UPI00203EEFDD|nr:hypothetical protein [Sporosarcina luteola]MCM3743216.1 hypothetical protein [Sporosarcina luteola]